MLFSSCMCRLYAILNYWYCGPSDTKAGQVARVTCLISTILIIMGCVFYFPYYVATVYIDHSRIKHNTYPSLFVKFSTISFYLALLGYIVAPIVGHGLCGMVNAICRDQTVNIEQEEGYELPSSIIILPSYQELFFSDEPPSYEEISIV
ncbi:hypothetical protein [Candidatus Mesenet endosymbiont of Agriotes lineatus]|uniref:hypothetical protein n=1 Tax=Candidatus Mesenet endosymbiont of Agriotes lineatus TaxID=3077948 RepID=UPI0030D4A63B